MIVIVSSSPHHCLASVLMVYGFADLLSAPAQSSVELRLTPLQALHDTSYCMLCAHKISIGTSVGRYQKYVLQLLSYLNITITTIIAGTLHVSISSNFAVCKPMP